MKKKLLSVLLVICALVSLIPNMTAMVSATEPITYEIVKQRIDELDTLLSGKYFTTNEQGCGKWANEHGCSNCNVNRVLNASWFKDLFGTVKPKQMFLNGGKSCMGFVEFAEWYIFRADNNDTVQRSSNIKYPKGFNYKTISQNAKTGDYIRANGHSFILISVDTSGIEVLDSNAYSTYNCRVSRHRIEFNNKNYSGKTIYISKMASKAVGAPVENVPSQNPAPTPTTYTVTFNPNGGKVAPASKTVASGADIGSLPTPTREGYDFLYWSTKTGNGGIALTGGGKFFVEENLTLYAIWKEHTDTIETPPKQTYTVTLDNGSTCKQIIVTNGSTYGNLTSPSKEGYTFDGWYTQKVGGSKVTSSTKVNLTGDQTLYAHWTQNHTHVKTNPQIGQEHPHYTFYTCTCGKVFTDNETNQLASCATCALVNAGQTTLDGAIDAIKNPPPQPSGHWGEWSEWSNTTYYNSDTRQVETRQNTQQIKISDGYTEYRYGGYVTSDGRHECWCETYLRNKFGSATLRYSDWSTTQYNKNGSSWTCGDCSGSHSHVDHYGNDGRPWWPEYTLSNGKNYYWEESRIVDAEYETRKETQYRYRDWIVE